MDILDKNNVYECIHNIEYFKEMKTPVYNENGHVKSLNYEGGQTK